MEKDDPLAALLGIDLTDPIFAAHLEKVEEQHARCVEYVCAFGYCIWEWDPVEGKIIGGWGATNCGCDVIDNDSLKLHKRVGKS